MGQRQTPVKVGVRNEIVCKFSIKTKNLGSFK